MVKRYAMTTEDSLRKNRPNDQVRPRRKSRANAPSTQDLIPPSRVESGFMEVECFTILYMVTIRMMRLSMIMKVTGPMKLQMKWLSTLSQQALGVP